MLEVQNLSVSYGKHQALENISISVNKGELVVILGANGAGKSTLLKSISGICDGDIKGNILINGSNILGLKPEAIVEKGIALVPEGRAIFEDLNVYENLKLGAFSERAQSKIYDNITLVYDLFPKLKERSNQISRTMSGGEQQMVAIGRAIMSAPNILMLDEPSLGLSPILSKELFNVLGKIRDKGIGVLILEQNAKLSLSVANRGYLFEVGKLVGEDSAKNLINNPDIQSAYLGSKKGKLNENKEINSFKNTNQNSETFSYITPSGLNGNKKNNLSIDKFNIEKLILNAENSAKIKPLYKGSKEFNSPFTEQKFDSVKTNHLNKKIILSEENNNNLNNSKKSKIQNLLNDFEEAAYKSRISNKETFNNENKYKNENTLETLPEIQIFRKSEIQVFKRDNTGQLRLIENVEKKGD
tara:strand:+ start:5131 stop:6375 length:1245 start_codon:yes stop_codon:yes gene_type:complete